MRIEQLSYFLEIAKTGSINKAAENLFVTQPGLSDSVKKMEHELDLQLLNRSKTGVTLTENGSIVARHAFLILNAYQNMLQELSLSTTIEDTQVQEIITVATTPLFAASILLDVIHAFREQHPMVSVRYVEANAEDVLQQIRDKKADLGFFSSYMAQPPKYSDKPLLTCTQLCQDELILCLSKKSPLAIQNSFALAKIKKEQMVTFFSAQTSPADNIIAVSNNIATQIEILLRGEAVACLPSHAFQRCFAPTKGLISRPIEPSSYCTYFMTHLIDHTLSPIKLEFMNCIEQRISLLFHDIQFKQV